MITHYPYVRRSARATHEPDLYGNVSQEMVAATCNCLLDDPHSYREAIDRPDHQKWREAMEYEIRNINQKHLCSIVNLPTGKKVTSTRWVYHDDNKPNGYIERYKARLVAKG